MKRNFLSISTIELGLEDGEFDFWNCAEIVLLLFHVVKTNSASFCVSPGANMPHVCCVALGATLSGERVLSREGADS